MHACIHTHTRTWLTPCFIPTMARSYPAYPIKNVDAASTTDKMATAHGAILVSPCFSYLPHAAHALPASSASCPCVLAGGEEKRHRCFQRGRKNSTEKCHRNTWRGGEYSRGNRGNKGRTYKPCLLVLFHKVADTGVADGPPHKACTHAQLRSNARATCQNALLH